ncbi:MAG: response regulator [Treponema sp.]|jgi:PAS domain S-box-containing protein|nr:response regulator [Treponema sp.]
MSEESQRLRDENAALALLVKKLNRQLTVQQNTALRFEKISANRDRLALALRMEQSKQEKYMNMMLENSPNIIIFLDGKGCFSYCTDTFLKISGIPHFGLINGLHFLEVFERFHNEAFLEHARDSIAQAVQIPSAVQSEKLLDMSGSGDIRCYITYTTAMRDTAGTVEGIMLLFHDITETLRAKNAAEEASRAKDVAEEASRAKSSFLATISHEIRTPLNAIIGLSEIQLQKELPDDTREDLEKVHNSGSALLGIINNILDISKIEAGNFELIPVEYDIPSLINDTVQLNIVRIASKPISLKLNIDDTLPRRLFGDELRIKQILNNLLSNAFKYTQEGTVTFQARWQWQDGDALLIFTINDTGQGIKKDDLGRLFSDYIQLDTRANRNIEGTGLGLSIAKKLTEMMDGSISVESEYGKGSAFTVQIRQKIVDPCSIGLEVAGNLQTFRFTERRRSRSKDLARAHMPYAKVLVVDDVNTNLDVARGLLLPYGLAIDCVQSGKEAIEKIREQKTLYDAIFMDHMMPEMDGIEATRIIRNEIGTEYAKSVPIIALTANVLAGNEDIFMSAGFNAFIAKPIDIMRLDVVLRQWVQDKQREGAIGKPEQEQAEKPSGTPGDRVLADAKIEGIDLKEGIKRFEEETIYLGILRSYAVHTPALLEKLRSPSPETLPAYAITVHGIKGASYGICAGAIGAWAEALERAAKAGDYEKIRGENAAFIALVERTLAGLEALLGNALEDRPVKQKATVPDEALLKELLDASKRFKPARMEEIIVTLEAYEYESGEELVAWLREQSDNLEYDAIRKRLETTLLKRP